MTNSDLMDIYSNGLAIDVATVGYLLVVPLLLIGLHWCFTRWNPRRWLMVYCGIMAVALSLAALADASLYEFWEFKLDRMAFFYLGDPKDAFASVSVGYLVLRFVAWVLLAVLTYYLLAWPMILSGRKSVRNTGSRSRKKGLWVAKVLLFMVLCGAEFAMIRGLRIWPNTPGRVFYSKITYYNHAALNPVFNLFYTLTKKEDDYRQFDAFDEEERARLMEGLFPTSADSTEILLNIQRPNVLVIVLEGFGSCFVEGCEGGWSEHIALVARCHLLHELLLRQFPHRPRYRLQYQWLPRTTHNQYYALCS